ncbi:MAG: cytochrome b/b6 domain-containing protein [Thiohalocapsa sp.]|nr:cytochrome b/b6 domain-containing protein [Thiohalocapsa sp.]MCF7989741.1 cytochrome b/b6 domain-containing protein [Thiohalocapsa sp.]
MTTSTEALPTLSAAERDTAAHQGSVRVWDPLVRIFHWSLVAAFATAYIVEDDLLGVHVWAGYLVLILIAVRVAWGFVGTRHARFGDFVRGPRQVLGYIHDALRFQARRYLGHNPAGGAMAIALMLLVSATGLFGMALYGAQELSGPLAPLMSGLPAFWGEAFEETHEVLANVTLVLIAAHVAGVIFSSLSHRENLVRSMFTGRKRRG